MSASSSSTSPSPSPSFVAAHSDFFAGAIGGAVGRWAEYPADAVKTKFQSALPIYSNKSTTQLVKYIWQHEGVRGFYGGVACPVAACALECSIAFSMYYGVSAALARSSWASGAPSAHHDYWIVAASGASSGLANGFLLTPIELVKCRVQSKPQLYPNVRVAVAKTFKEEGIRAFGGGFVGTLARELIGSMGFFCMIELTMRSLFAHHTDAVTRDLKDDAPVYVLPICGGAAGFGLLAIPYAIDTVKTNMQIDSELARKGFRATTAHLWRAGGVRALYTGFGITMLRAFPANACIVSVTEYLRGKFSGHHHHHHSAPKQEQQQQVAAQASTT